jgi:uncharacterized protein (TIGR02271 family)
MAIIKYSKQDEYDLANSGQDCLGWEVIDQGGNKLGTVTEMLIDTEREMVDSIIVNRRLRVPAADLALRDGHVVIRGIFEGGELHPNESAESGMADEDNNYPVSPPRAQNTRSIAGVTREAQENEIRIPVIEEELRIGKRTVKRGGARIQTRVEEVPVQEKVALHEENVTVERRPANRLVENAPGAFKEGTIEVTEMSEVPVIDKQVRVSEEIVVNKEVTEHEETVRDTVRRRDVEVDKYTTDDSRRRNS